MILSGKYRFSRPTSLNGLQQNLCRCRYAFYSMESQAMPSSASEDRADLLKMSAKQHQKDSTEAPRWFKKFAKQRYRVDQQVKAHLYNQGLTGLGKGALPKLILNSAKELPNVQGEIVFGVHPVKLALQSQHRLLHTLYVKLKKNSTTGEKFDEENAADDNSNERLRELLRIARAKEVPIRVIRGDLMNILAGNRPHQGVCLDAGIIDFIPVSVNGLGFPSAAAPPQLWLFLDRVWDPMNFGAIIRTAYFMGVRQVFVRDQGTCRLSPVVSKASAGVLEVLPIQMVENVAAFMKKLKEEAPSGENFQIFGTAASSPASRMKSCVPDASVIFADAVEHRQHTMLILGNEGSGIADDLREFCDAWISIRPGGGTGTATATGAEIVEGLDCLNVSVACGILLYSFIRSSRLSHSPIK